jgi:hypothetical protein
LQWSAPAVLSIASQYRRISHPGKNKDETSGVLIFSFSLKSIIVPAKQMSTKGQAYQASFDSMGKEAFFFCKKQHIDLSMDENR